MEMIRKPLKMSEQENRAMLAASEQRKTREGDDEGNRHARRLAARHARLELRKEKDNVV